MSNHDPSTSHDPATRPTAAAAIPPVAVPPAAAHPVPIPTQPTQPTQSTQSTQPVPSAPPLAGPMATPPPGPAGPTYGQPWAPVTAPPQPLGTPTYTGGPAGGGPVPPTPPPLGAGAGSGSTGSGSTGNGDDRRRGGGIRSALVGGLVGAIVAGGLVSAAMWDDNTSTVPMAQEVATESSRPANTIAGDSLDIKALLDKVSPSVVSIHTGTRQGEAAGSGIVLTEDGLVLTNAHVIDGAQTIQVDFADGRSTEARVIGSAAEYDVALVKAEGLTSPVTPAELGRSDDLQVGDDVVAIGNALNLGDEPSVTTGIVSATGRSISAGDGMVLTDLIQTDAAINPGNSGGPLLNSAGQVVGVNTAILADAQNVGFALSIDSITSIIDDLKAGREVAGNRPVLGVETVDVASVSPTVLQRFAITATAGAFVQRVESGSGADTAGLQAGDVIVAVDAKRVRTSADVGEAVRANDPGDRIEVTIERSGQEQTVTATLGSN